MAETLVEHAAEHGSETIVIVISMLPHFLKRDSNAHLTAGNGDDCIEKIEVWQLAVDAIIDYVERFEVVVKWVVNDNSSL